MQTPAQQLDKRFVAFTPLAMAHPGSDEHSRDMYRTAEEARNELLKALPDAERFERRETGE